MTDGSVEQAGVSGGLHGPWLPQDVREAVGRIAAKRRAGVLETIVRLLREAVGRTEEARRWGKQGGLVRASQLTPAQRQALARLGGLARQKRRQAAGGNTAIPPVPR